MAMMPSQASKAGDLRPPTPGKSSGSSLSTDGSKVLSESGRSSGHRAEGLWARGREEASEK